MSQASNLELKILEPHPFLARFRILGAPRAAGAVAIGSLSLFLLAAASDGTLWQGHLSRILCLDLHSYLGARSDICNAEVLSTHLTATRDIAGLILLMIFPMTVPLMFRQWKGIRFFLASMDHRRILTVSDRLLVENEVDQCNAFFRKWSQWNPAVGLVAVISVLMVARAQTTGRVYPILQTGPSQHGIAPEDWWLSLTGTGAAGALYFLVGCAVVYVILLQNIHGSRVVFLLWRLRNVVEYGATLSEADGYNGWSEVREVLFATWSLTIIHGLSIGLVALSLPAGHTLALAPLAVQWLVVTPFYILLPGALVRRNVSSWKRRQRIQLQAASSKAGSTGEEREIGVLLDEIDGVRVNPYAGLIGRGVHYLGVFGTVVFVIQVLLYIYG